MVAKEIVIELPGLFLCVCLVEFKNCSFPLRYGGSSGRSSAAPG